MTSQKSLNNNVNTRDFLRSLVSAILFPAIAFIVLGLFVSAPVITEIVNPLNRNEIANTVSYFLSESSFFYYESNLMIIGMVLCGMLTAVKQYYFIMRKNQVNVYLSLGISRVRMFADRAAAGLIMLFASVFIPMFAIYIVNIVYFGLTLHLTKVFLYVTMALFIGALGGFAIGAFAVSVSGNIFEAGLTCFTTSTFGSLATSLFNGMRESMLKGYVELPSGNIYLKLLSPFSFVIDLNAKKVMNGGMGDYYSSTYYYPLTAVMSQLKREVPADKYKIPEELVIDRGFIIPLCIALVIFAAFLALAVILFKKRKAEHANSLGHFKVSSFINSAFVFTGAVLILTEAIMYGIGGGWKLALGIVLMIVVPLFAYFIIQLILTRKIKATLRSLIPASVLTAVTLLAILTMQTGVFGLYNRTPDKADIKSVAIDVIGHPALEKRIDVYDLSNILESSDREDIETVISVFDRIKKEKYQDTDIFSHITVSFRDKDENVKYREFPIYSEDTYEEYLKVVYNSNYFDKVLNEVLFAEPDIIDDGNYEYYEDSMMNEVPKWRYLDSDSLVTPESSAWENCTIEDTTELKQHLYNDISKMTYEELFKNNSRPLGLITCDYSYAMNADTVLKKAAEDEYYYYYNEETEDNYSAIGSPYIYIYPEMKETIAFLQEMDYEFASTEHSVKEILYTDSKLSLVAALSKYAEEHKDDYSGYGSYDHYVFMADNGQMFERSDGSFYIDIIRFYIAEDINTLTLLKEVYNVSGHPLISVTDPSTVNGIMNGCIPLYLTINDNGKYAFVIYDDGTIAQYYIPQANLGVLK